MSHRPEAEAKLRRVSGFSLIEMVIAMVVLAISLTGSMMVMETTLRRSADPMLQHQAVAIAETYMEEILLQSYIDPDLDPITGAVCPTKEASRNLYDNICDYNAISDVGAQDQGGNAITGLSGYTIDVSVDTSASLNTLSGSTEVLRIDIQISHPSLSSFSISAYRTKS
jgi:MSHA pilin protein MshD